MLRSLALALTVAVLGHATGAVAAPPAGCGTVRVGLNGVAADTWFTGTRDAPEGPLADLAQRALASVGCEAVVQRMPLARLLADIEQGAVDLALVLTVTEERRRSLRFPTTPSGSLDARYALGLSRVSLYALASQAEALNRRRLDRTTLNLTVAVQRASVGAEQARAAGWTLSYAPDPQRAAAMVRLQRADLLAAPEWAMSRESLAQEPALVALRPPLALQPYFAPVSPAFWARDPARVEAIWRALCQHAALLGGSEPACPGLNPPTRAAPPKRRSAP